MSDNVQTQATNLLAGIPFANIIGGPLVAAIDAQGQAAMQAASFILSVGFNDTTGSGGTGTGTIPSARTVQFTYNKGGTAMTLEVPLLTIVPIPFLRITTMSISFTANIQADTSNSVQTTDTTDFNASVSGSVDYWILKTNFNASVSNTSTTTQSASSQYNVQYTMNVTVNAAQDQMPAGLQSILNILTSSITPAPANASS